jgi:hypothetical protein
MYIMCREREVVYADRTSGRRIKNVLLFWNHFQTPRPYSFNPLVRLIHKNLLYFMTEKISTDVQFQFCVLCGAASDLMQYMCKV